MAGAGVDMRRRITHYIEEFVNRYDGDYFNLTVNMINKAIAPKFDDFNQVRKKHKPFLKEEATRLVKEALAKAETGAAKESFPADAREDEPAQLQPQSTPDRAKESAPLVASASSETSPKDIPATDSTPSVANSSETITKDTPAPEAAAPAAAVDDATQRDAAAPATTRPEAAAPATSSDGAPPMTEVPAEVSGAECTATSSTPTQEGKQKRARDIPQTTEELCEWMDEMFEMRAFGTVPVEARKTFIKNVQEQAIDAESVLCVTDQDLKELGLLLMGPRRIFLNRIKETFGKGKETPTPGDGRTLVETSQPSETAPRLNLQTAFTPSAVMPSEQLSPGGAKQPSQAEQVRSHEQHVSTPPEPSKQASAVDSHPDRMQTEGSAAESAGALGPGPMEVDAPASAGSAVQVAQEDASSRSASDERGEAQNAGQGGGEEAASSAAGAGALVDADQAERDAEQSERDVLKMSEKVKEQMQTEEFCVNACQWAVKKTTAVFTELFHTRWASDVVKQAKLSELQDLSKRMTLPASSFVTFGDTGAGKSTLLNALIGEANILPTNGMRACTATIIELSHNKESTGPNYVGEAEFVTGEEWMKELDTLVDDLTQQDGRCIIMEPDSKAPNYQAYCKLNAIYGIDYRNSYTNDVLPNGQRARKNLMAVQLKSKLIRHPVSRHLGTTKREQSDDPARFRKLLEKYMETPNSIEGSQLWPLVKRVRIRGRNWKALESGAILVDAPGVNDDNSARDKVVKEYLKKADGVWIVANMKRACNNKTAKDMLGQSFRRQLLMDGQYGSLAFIATQSDEFQRSDVIRSIGLHPDSTIEQCAMARKEWVRTRIQNDFYDGLEEMQRLAGEQVNSEQIRSKYQLPVFCVSSVDFQILSGVRTADGAARAFRHTFGTEVPKLQQFVHETTLKRRYVNVRRQAELLVQFYKGIEAMLEESGNVNDHSMMVSRQKAVVNAVAGLTRDVHVHTTEFDKYLSTSFSKDLAPLLNQGAKLAQGDCVGTAEGWRSMHWATYKATVRRMGAFRANWNEELAEAVFRNVSMEWERALVTTLGKKLDDVKDKCMQSVKQAHHAIAQSLNADAARIASVRQPQEQAASLQLSSLTDQVMSISQNQQRELSRSVAPHIQQVMEPGYSRGAAEAGQGSHARRKAIIESHLRDHRGEMFAEATSNIASDLDKLRKQIKQVLSANIVQLANHIKISYSSFWSNDNSPEAQRSRAQFLDQLKSSKFEAESNLRKLLVSHGDWEDEDGAEDVQAVEPEPEVEVIDLCSDSEEPYVPPPQSQASMTARVGVKLEKGLSVKRDPAVVVVMGATGAGKSTLINAVLGEIDLLPTNSMRACTATIIEIVYKPPGGKKYAAQVDFLSQAEWWAQVTWLINAIQAPGGSGINVPEEDTPAHEVYCKVRAAYGSGVNLAAGPRGVFAASQGGAVAKALGTSVRVEADTARELLQLYGPYVDSTNETASESVWPIVKTVRLEGPFEVLQPGVTLVDSPGLGDDDSARNAAVKHFLAKADAVWLAGNIKRAVNEKTIKDMMPAQLRRQVVRTGATGSLCVIATQSDDAVASELISNLALPENASKLDTILARNKFVKDRLEKDFFAGTGKVPKAPSARKPQRFQLKTFTASATEFQKLSKVRNDDGAAQTFTDVAQTDVPALREQIRATASLTCAQGPKLGRVLLECKEKADAAARGEGDEMDEDEGFDANESGSDNDVPPPPPPGPQLHMVRPPGQPVLQAGRPPQGLAARPSGGQPRPVLAPGERVVKCSCGTNLKVKSSVRSHCPRCYQVFNPPATASGSSSAAGSATERGGAGAAAAFSRTLLASYMPLHAQSSTHGKGHRRV